MPDGAAAASLDWMSTTPEPHRPTCPHCSEPIGAYEPVWWTSARIGAQRTSLLKLGSALGPGESLWHVACAETHGIDGG
jgi:hypothetical protein